MTVNGIRHSTLTLTTTALGGGVLAVSFVFQLCGLALGLLLLVAGAVVAYMSIAKLMRMSRDTHTDSYAALFSHCAGPRAGPILDFLLFIYGNGSCVGYLVFIADFVPQVCKFLAPHLFLADRTWAIIMAACVTAPFSVQRDTDILRFVAPVSIISLIYVAVVICAQTPHLAQQHIGAEGFGRLEWIQPAYADIPEAFAICCFAFNCHLNVIPVASTLVRPTDTRIKSVSCKVNTLQGMFYCLIGVSGYLSWLAETPGDLLTAYSPKDVSIAVARIMLTLTMLIALPMNFVPSIRSGLQLGDYFRGQSLAAETRPAVPRVLLTLVCSALQVILAIKVPKVTDVISLLGATVATAMIMGIPAYCMGKTMERSARNRATMVVLYLFALLGLASVPIKVLKQAHVIKQ